MLPDSLHIPLLGLTIAEAVKVSGVGRSTIYQELAAGRLVARKLGRRTLIMVADLHAWLERLPPLKPSKARA